MALKTMYPAAANSPGTELAEDITAAQTTITVISGNALPEAPNLFTIGSDETAETVQYTGKDGNILTECIRGFDGTTAKGWTVGAKVARYFTAYDHDTFRGNIADLDELVTRAKETADVAKATADKAETPTGAQQKVDKALADAKTHTNTVIDNMAKDYKRFPVYGDYSVDGPDANTVKVNLPDTTQTAQYGMGVSFIAHKDVTAANIVINSDTTKFKVVRVSGGNATDIKKGTLYSGLLVGTDFLLDSGSANGGAAETVYAYYGESLSAGDDVAGYMYKIYNVNTTVDKFGIGYTGRAYSVDSSAGLVAFALDSSPYFAVYKIEGNKYTKLPNPTTMPSAPMNDVKISVDGDYIVVGGQGGLYVYRVSDYSLTLIKTDNPGGTVGKLAFGVYPIGTSFNVYFAASYSGYNIGAYRITKNSNNVERLSSTISQSDRSVSDIKFISPTNFVVSHSGGYQSLREYEISGTSFSLRNTNGSYASFYAIAIRPTLDYGIVSCQDGSDLKVYRFAIENGKSFISTLSAFTGFARNDYFKSMFFTKNNDAIFGIIDNASGAFILRYEVIPGASNNVTETSNGFGISRHIYTICESSNSSAIFAGVVSPPTNTYSMQENLMAPKVFKGTGFRKFYASSILGKATITASASDSSTNKIDVKSYA